MNKWTALFFLGMTVACFGPKKTGPESVMDPRYDGLQATFWVQSSSEYRALCLQAYATAAHNLDALAADPGRRAHIAQRDRDAAQLPPAVIVDVDETVLDNSPYQVFLLDEGTGFSDATWTRWVERREALPIPGSLEFLKSAAAKGVAVFYISNRREKLREATLDNLRLHGFPLADNALLLRETTSDKEPRRERVAENYRIIMMIGDVLGDFHSAFDETDSAHRHQSLNRFHEHLGRDWILLPNPLYGRWEAAAYGGARLNPQEQREQKLKHLRRFQKKEELSP